MYVLSKPDLLVLPGFFCVTLGESRKNRQQKKMHTLLPKLLNFLHLLLQSHLLSPAPTAYIEPLGKIHSNNSSI